MENSDVELQQQFAHYLEETPAFLIPNTFRNFVNTQLIMTNNY